MRKFTLIIFFIISLLPLCQTYSQDNRRTKPAETEQNNIILTVEGSIVHIQNINTKTPLEIYNILGVKINSTIIDSTDKTITLNLPKGCYILKIQDVVRKIAIK